MQRNTLILTVTCTLGGLGCLTENPSARPSSTDFWTTLGGDTGYDGGDTEGDNTDSSDSADSDDDDDDDDDGGGRGDGDPGHDPDSEEDEPCASLSQVADVGEGLADIIFIVDNSGSMTEEAEFVQTQMNGFSDQIQMSGIDYHVVLISSYPDEDNGICIDPPLGSGNCPGDDTNLPVYRHVDEKVSSHDALERLILTHQEWKDSMRPDAVKHIVVISDDESDIGSILFKSEFVALDPDYDPFLFHAIVCPWECEQSDGIGQVYMDLVGQTGGVLGDLCQQDFQTVFDELAENVIQNSPLACQFDIPPAPMDQNLDPDLVTVELDDGNNNIESIPKVIDLADCMNHPDGWYYDDPVNPTQILLCPQTCAKAQGYGMGTINMEFECDPYPPAE